MPGDDSPSSDWTRMLVDVSRRVARWSRDYIGIPFSGSGGGLPFQVDGGRRAGGPKAYGVEKGRWRKGDPIVGFYTTGGDAVGGKVRRVVLNLPDGSSMLDMCYPGWEVAVVPRHALDHFLNRRYLFGDYHAHLLTGNPLHQMRGTAERRDAVGVGDGGERRWWGGEQEGDEIERAMARHAEVFARRRERAREMGGVEHAARAQQARGVPFDAHPDAEAYARSVESSNAVTREDAGADDGGQIARFASYSHTSTARSPTPEEADTHDTPNRKLVRVTVTKEHVRGGDGPRSRTTTRREFDNGDIDTDTDGDMQSE
ncbi:hypothetical protein PYCC9005_000145 [Savitreella phatthalungensis]